ncbi:MAG TPA: UvrB/UvrC motif-containing protein, partial [Humisphaera sp.]
ALPGKAQAAQPAGDLADPRQSKDIAAVLRGWDYEAGAINVRKVSGADGRPKLQMRLDLGLLQMEMTGRPDGRRPFGHESLLEYHEKRLAEHRRRHGSADGYEISSEECQSLREEAVMYYQRYLSLFVLEEFPGVVRDTARNLKVLDLCNAHAAEDDDKVVLEQYRPYITMMHARAKASIHVKAKRYREALACIDAGIDRIREFFERFGRPEAYEHANEVKLLKRFARGVRKKLPVDPVKRLQKRLDKAIKEERYESAAKLRDKLAAMKGQPEGPPSARA